MLVASTFLLIHAHKRRSPAVPWLYYCPVVILACSVVQYGATLWGFQMAWYLVLLALALVVVLMDRNELTVPTLALAIGAGVIGSFSSLQGLLVWPVGMVLILYRGRSRPIVAAWIVAAGVTTALYLYHLNIKAGSVLPSSLTHHSVSPAFFHLRDWGCAWRPNQAGRKQRWNFVLGLVIVVVALAALGLCGLRRDKTSASPVGAALICFGLFFSIVVCPRTARTGLLGRKFFGLHDLRCMDTDRRVHGFARPESQVTRREADPPKRSFRAVLIVEGRNTYRYAIWLVLAFMVLQSVIGIGNGLDGARTIHAAELKSASTAQNINRVSDLEILDNLNFYQPPALTRMQVHIAEALHLSLFAGTRHSRGAGMYSGQRKNQTAQRPTNPKRPL